MADEPSGTRGGKTNVLEAEAAAGSFNVGKRPSSGTPNGEKPPKKMQNESKILDFSSPGSKQAAPDLSGEGARRTLRSGKTYNMSQNAEEIEPYEVFADREGSLEEKALNLVTQLKEFFDDEKDGEEDDEESLNPIWCAAKSFEQDVANEKSRVLRSAVVLGYNGIGKSFLINLWLLVTQVTEPQYGLNGIESRIRAQPTNDSRLRTLLCCLLEGLLEIKNNNSISNGCETKTVEDAERKREREREIEDRVVFSPISSTEKDGHYMSMEKREKEEAVLQKFRAAYKSGPPDKEYKDGFMLPSEGNAKSTTQIVVKIRKGTVYHMVIRYKTEHDIREELGTFNWDKLEDDNDDLCEMDLVDNKYKIEMLLRVIGLDPKKGHTHEEVDKPKVPGEVQICAAIKKKLELGFEIFSGRGWKLLDDRLYVRNKLWDVMRDPQLAYIIHECIVYVPADVLEGLELMDAPGIGVENPQEQVRLTEALRNADAIVVTMQRNLQDDTGLKLPLEKCGVLKNIIEKSKLCRRVFLFSAMDEKSGFSKLNTKKACEEFQKNIEELRCKNVEGLKSLLKKTFKRKDKDMTEDMMLADCLPALEADMFQSYPLLWASLALSSGEKDDEEEISRSEKEKLLCGVSKMLSALKEFGVRGRHEPLADGMEKFLEEIKSFEFSQTVKVDPAVTPAALTENMRKVAKREASKQAFRRGRDEHEFSTPNKKIQVDNMKRQFDLKVYIPLRNEHETFIQTTLATATTKMLENVDVDGVIKEVQNKITKTGQDPRKWRTLQKAFSPQYRGSYPKLDFFNCFFGNFTLPSTDELEKSIENLREYFKDQVQKFMIDQIIEMLQSSEGTGTRASHAEGVSDAIKTLVEKVVKECISSSQSKILDEALTLLKPKSLTLLTKNKSLKKILDDSQIESLKNNLLNDPDIRNANTAAATTVTLINLYRRKVQEKAKVVINEAKKKFSKKIEANGRNIVLEELKDRFVEKPPRERRGKEPVLFKLWRACFKRIADLHEGESDLIDDNDKSPQQLLYLEEFKCKWQDLLARVKREMPIGNAEESHCRFQESIYLRHFLCLLESEYQLPTKCKAPKTRLAKCELKTLTQSESIKVIRMMKQGTSHVDTGWYLKFKNQLDGWNLTLGYCKYDKHCLFRTLDQILHGFCKDSEEEMEEEGGQGSSDTGAAPVSDRDKMVKLRRSIVCMVLEKHQTKEQLQTFEKCWNESVGDWARRMQEQEDYGDTVCIEYFARHFHVTIRVYTPVCEEPMQFPMYLEQQAEIVADKSVYRIAHVPFKPGEEVRPNYYVPVWVSFMPRERHRSPRGQRPEGERRAGPDSAQASPSASRTNASPRVDGFGVGGPSGGAAADAADMGVGTERLPQRVRVEGYPCGQVLGFVQDGVLEGVAEPGGREGKMMVHPPETCSIMFVPLVYASLLFDSTWAREFSDRTWKAGWDFLEQVKSCLRGWEKVYPGNFESWARKIGQSTCDKVRQARNQVGQTVRDMLRAEERQGVGRLVRLVPFPHMEEYRLAGLAQYHRQDLQEACIAALDMEQTTLMEACLAASLGITGGLIPAVRGREAPANTPPQTVLR